MRLTVPATSEHAASIAARLPLRDAAVFVELGIDPAILLQGLVSDAHAAICLVENGEPIVLLGMMPSGYMWAIFAEAEWPARWIATECKAFAAAMSREFPLILMTEGSDHPKSLKLARWCGFVPVAAYCGIEILELRAP